VIVYPILILLIFFLLIGWMFCLMVRSIPFLLKMMFLVCVGVFVFFTFLWILGATANI